MSAILILAFLGGGVWLALKHLRKPPLISTGPEMDAVLMDKYKRDVEKYHRTIEAWQYKREIATASGAKSQFYNTPPKPPVHPRLSTDA